MSRIRGIEPKVQKVLQTRRNGINENSTKKNEDQSAVYTKDDVDKQQIQELLCKLPKLEKIFDVHRKIGEGTFSSVYLGSLRQHSHLSDTSKRWFAIKHLVPTAHPARIEHELRCLQDMGGKNNVIGVELCLRHLDTIVFVMPYIPHRKFSEYVGDMDAAELRQYMRALLVALRHVHSFGVIHRDVKPSNFLYDRENRRYLLVDFGLAQRESSAPPPARAPGPPRPPRPPRPPPPAHAAAGCGAARKRARDQNGEEDEVVGGKRVALDLSVARPATSLALPGAKAAPPAPPAPPSAPPPPPRCACGGAGALCGACAARPPPRAPRAGTQGFRPPEEEQRGGGVPLLAICVDAPQVLLKVQQQTTAVDVWACGVVLCSVLCARYPFFRAPDDVSALAELADLLGTAALQRAAAALGRRVVTSSWRHGLCLRKLCARLRSAAPAPPPDAGPAPGPAPAPPPGPAPLCVHCRLPRDSCLCRDAEEVPEGPVAGFPASAFSLAARLLEPDPRRRLSAVAALLHPFLAAD